MKVFPKPTDNRFLSMKAAIQNTDKGKCWAPLTDCRNAPIRAHSVQNSRILDAIQEDGVVMKIESEVRDRETHLAFKKVGRNKATTFRGFCGIHDAELFQPLDTESLETLTKKQKALLTWRGITHEMADKMAIGFNFQNEYQKLIEAGEADANKPHPLGMEAILWMKILYDFHTYRAEQLDGYIAGVADLKNYRFKHHVLNGTGAVVAASSFFTFEESEQAYLAFNVYPWNDDTHVLFGYSQNHTCLAAPLARSVLTKSRVDPAKLSSMIIGRMHNFVLKPSIVNAWSDEKRERILKAYGNTIVTMDAIEATENVNLFI